jgi:hypothetical protein
MSAQEKFDEFWIPIASLYYASRAYRTLAWKAFYAGRESVWEEITIAITDKNARKKCRACGQDGVWCSVYTSCPLNKGGEHQMETACITVKGRQFEHSFDYSGAGDDRHCLFCRIDERDK